MYGSRIVSGLAAVFAGMTALFFVLSFVYSLVFLPVAAMFGLATYFVWYHASGRFASRLYRGIESRPEAWYQTKYVARPNIAATGRKTRL